MEKDLELTFIYETYKSLLTNKMKEIFELYFYSDLSLREIGEQKEISFQAVNDTLKKTEKLLYEYESKLRYVELKKDIIKLNAALDKENVDLNEVKEIAKKLGDI